MIAKRIFFLCDQCKQIRGKESNVSEKRGVDTVRIRDKGRRQNGIRCCPPRAT